MGALFAAGSYGLLSVAHTQPWNIYVAAGLLGIGMAFGFASMSNLIVEAVPPSQTGVATGMNTNVRNIGAALGSGIATSVIVSGGWSTTIRASTATWWPSPSAEERWWWQRSLP